MSKNFRSKKEKTDSWNQALTNGLLCHNFYNQKYKYIYVQTFITIKLHMLLDVLSWLSDLLNN